VTRDLLHVDLRTEKTSGDQQAVESAINQAMAKALAMARQQPGIDIDTGFYSINREFDKHPPQWSGSQSLFLSSTDASTLLKLAGELQAQGLVMSSLHYEASPKTMRGVEDELTSQALSALERRAEAIAEQLHLSVLRYRNLTIGSAQTRGSPMPLFEQSVAATAMPPPVAAPGEAPISVTVVADILLGPKQP
jgi:predicted secreted protein